VLHKCKAAKHVIVSKRMIVQSEDHEDVARKKAKMNARDGEGMTLGTGIECEWRRAKRAKRAQ
jgi:hypothetical protein